MSEGLPSMQSTSNTGGHTEDDERYLDVSQLAVIQVISSKQNTDKRCNQVFGGTPVQRVN